ncbi:hypothetical protein CBER1_05977 [Cercospora berteroae]|uniref:Serine carboxypeptidase S28 n=1 Tax=Cercospora berteroae TaxID=357750 RepID=A0A2S6C4K2_9PEZI|nr:hypothetical protein CBER1_05977 [Cercospora berteroae]
MQLLTLILGTLGAVDAVRGPWQLRQSPRAIARRQAKATYQAYTIDQPIDHFHNETKYAPHTNATVKQRYFFDSSYYKPGGPVFLYIGGETNGQNRFSNLETGIIQILMEATNGLGVILENRYYGESFPFNTSSTDELRFLTTEQTIADNAYFAQHATFPGVNATLTAPDTPWILYGGSLAGAQTALSVKTYPDVLWAWQEIIWGDNGSNDFFHFCNNVTNLDAPSNITSIDHELSSYTYNESWPNLGNYANYIKQYLISTCTSGGIASTSCFGTQNQTYYADTTNSASRSYLYSTCTESGAYQVANPTGPSLLSRVVQLDYTQQWCDWAFPPGEHNRIPSTPDLRPYNKYGGYNVIADRLAHMRWRSRCLVGFMLPFSRHHWDSYGIKNVSAEQQFIRAAHEWEIRVVKKWLQMFNGEKSSKERRDEL